MIDAIPFLILCGLILFFVFIGNEQL